MLLHLRGIKRGVRAGSVICQLHKIVEKEILTAINLGDI